MKQWMGQFLNNPIYFIFPMLTCISFYEDSDSVDEVSNAEDEEKVEENEASVGPSENEEPEVSMEPRQESIEQIIEEGPVSHDGIVAVDDAEEIPDEVFEDPCEQNSTETKKAELEDKKMLFSKHQSNILFFLFVLGFTVSIGGDLAFQKSRYSKMPLYKSTTFPYLIIFMVYLLLWVDFIIAASNKTKGLFTMCSPRTNFFIDLFTYSTSILVCIVLIPLYAARKIYNW